MTMVEGRELWKIKSEDKTDHTITMSHLVVDNYLNCVCKNIESNKINKK